MLIQWPFIARSSKNQNCCFTCAWLTIFFQLSQSLFRSYTLTYKALFRCLPSVVFTGEENRGEMRDGDVFAFQRTLVAHIITPPWNLSIFLYHPTLKSVLPRTKSECGSFQFSNYKWQVKLTKIGRSTGALPALVGKPNSNHRQQREGSSGIGLENCLFNIPSAVTNTTDTTVQGRRKQRQHVTTSRRRSSRAIIWCPAHHQHQHQERGHARVWTVSMLRILGTGD